MAVDYSVIIPAYNEEILLPNTLAVLKKAMGDISGNLQGEIIVVDNNSSDRTAEIAAGEGAKVVFESVNQISRARNAGGKAATGRYLVFLDADTEISTELLQQALDNLSAGDCCGGGCIVGFKEEIPFSARQFAAAWNWMAARFGLAAGCFIYCLKAGFDAVGGFSEKVFASEEVWFSRGLVIWGKKQKKVFKVIAEPKILTSARKMEWHSTPILIGIMIFLMIFPWGVRSKWLCKVWYSRPKL